MVVADEERGFVRQRREGREGAEDTDADQHPQPVLRRAAPHERLQQRAEQERTREVDGERRRGEVAAVDRERAGEAVPGAGTRGSPEGHEPQLVPLVHRRASSQAAGILTCRTR